MASTLDPSNPDNDYVLYALYKRKAMESEQRRVLLDALEKDPNNPFGHFAFGDSLEREKHTGQIPPGSYETSKRHGGPSRGQQYRHSGGGYRASMKSFRCTEKLSSIAKL